MHRDSWQVSKLISSLLSWYRQIRTAVACKKLCEIKDNWRAFDVIGIDEGQFFEDVSPPIIIYWSLRLIHNFKNLDRWILGESSKFRKSCNNVSPEWNLAKKGMGQHSWVNPTLREGKEIISHLQNMLDKRKLHFQNLLWFSTRINWRSGNVYATLQRMLQRKVKVIKHGSLNFTFWKSEYQLQREWIKRPDARHGVAETQWLELPFWG